MKKIISFAVLTAALSTALVSCSKDDDSSSSSNTPCTTCSLSAFGITTTTSVCDNGDGTLAVTINGVEQTVTASYDAYVQGLTAAGANCN